MTTVDHQLLSAQEYWLLPENGMQRALVRGEVYEQGHLVDAMV